MATNPILVVFVHGWSVTHTDTYGGLPRRLSAEAAAAGLDIRTEDIYLGKYISFRDEVRVTDIARAFDSAVERQLRPSLDNGRRFVCITHSTGGPVIRLWWRDYYKRRAGSGACPMSHLVMLAPANHGSALAQLGKGRLSRLKFAFQGVEPGQGVLDWLELGSDKAWELNSDWIETPANAIGAQGLFPFVLTGQSIDRAFYDNLNSYTGELGSDGVVRSASANLNARYIQLTQQAPVGTESDGGQFRAPALAVSRYVEAPQTAFRILAGKSHSGGAMGIMRSVHAGGADPGSMPTIQAILDAIAVSTKNQYQALCRRWAEETRQVQDDELVEKEDRILRDRYFIHDRCSMVIFRLRDDRDFALADFDLLLTAGAQNDPNHLPEGFLQDRQRNRLNPECITYYFNYDLMKGTGEVVHEGKVIRGARTGTDSLGVKLAPRPGSGFVHYLPCGIETSAELLDKALQPNATTLIDIRLRRLVHANVFDVEALKTAENSSFKHTRPAGELAT